MSRKTKISSKLSTIHFWQNCPSRSKLRQWVKAFLDLNIPSKSICPSHASPLDYLWQAYNEPAADLLVWGPRGGGKTRLGAIATLLDLLHKPGVQIRVLGGSLEQSMKMWDYLLEDLNKILPNGFTRERAGRVVRIKRTGSSAAVLPQSQRAVRGVHVQKLRCDEVELFKPPIWQAAQLVTKSKGNIAGIVEAMSTMHEPGGVMENAVDNAAERKIPVLRWCLLEVLAKCPKDRDCNICPLLSECKRRAKTDCDGYLSIDDAIRMKQRSSLETWETEMMCLRPRRSGRVFGNFDPQLHVQEFDGKPDWLAIDFGYANPFVCLWICDQDSIVKVVDEYIMSGKIVDEHVKELSSRYSDVKRVACDPAGNGRNEQTGESTIAVLKRNGYLVKSRKSGILEGVEKIRAALCNGDRHSSLLIHPRCTRLIKALRCYQLKPGAELPIKDGEHDHAIDALRYFFINREGTCASARLY